MPLSDADVAILRQAGCTCERPLLCVLPLAVMHDGDCPLLVHALRLAAAPFN